MTYVENFRFLNLKYYKMRGINDGDVMFFGSDSRNASQSLYYFDSAQN
jgi:hypothetical protein